MKSLSRIFTLALLLIIFGSFALCIRQSMKYKKLERTELAVTNGSEDTILVYLTLNNDADYLGNVNGVFGIKSTNKLQGSFTLKPHDTAYYTSSMPMSGNISFVKAPMNCPFEASTTLFEFNVNNYGTAKDAQETMDISCVAGVNTIGRFEVSGGGAWVDGLSDTITSIQNDSLYKNFGISGVYPYGCTNCINHDGMEDCKGHPKYAKPNTHHICNVQRYAKLSGGRMVITYLKSISYDL